MNNTQTPYSHLTPELILDAVESIGFQCNGSLLALNSYENRVYQVGIEDADPLIGKFYRPHRWSVAAIIEEHQFSWELAEHDLPVVPPLRISSQQNTLHCYQDFHFAVFPRQGGRTLDLDNAEHLAWMGRLLGRLHAVGACHTFSYRQRLSTENYGHQSYRFLIEHEFIPIELKLNYCSLVEEILKQIELCFERVGPLSYLRLHGDCHPGNILWNTTGPFIVDLDDCLTGPAIQDLWMLLSATNSMEMKAQLQQILYGYEEFNEFNFRETYLIEALRTLRMIHYSAWLARRWQDPTFPLHFPWFNTPNYWQEQFYNLQHQLQLLVEVNQQL